MLKNKIRNKKINVAENMPPLYHTLPNQSYEHEKSEVLKWLSERPELISYVLDQVRNANKIYYNPDTGKWQGVDWEDEEE